MISRSSFLLLWMVLGLGFAVALPSHPVASAQGKRKKKDGKKKKDDHDQQTPEDGVSHHE